MTFFFSKCISVQTRGKKCQRSSGTQVDAHRSFNISSNWGMVLICWIFTVLISGLSTGSFPSPPLLLFYMIFQKLRSNPYTASVITALTWVPAAIFFVDHGYSYATISGRSMQVEPESRNILQCVFTLKLAYI